MDNEYTLSVGADIDIKDIEKQLDLISKKEHATIKVKADTKEVEKLKTVVYKGTDAFGRLVTVTEKFNKQQVSMGAYITDTTEKLNGQTNSTKKLKEELNNTSKVIKNTNSNLSKTSGSLHSIGQNFLDTTMKVAKFGLSTKIIGGVQDALREGITVVHEYDDSIAELKKVTDLSSSSLKSFEERAFSLAETLSTTATNVVDATTEFSKSGFSLMDSEAMAKQALIFKTIADGEISASDAATTLIQVTKAYNLTAQDSEHIINAINKV